MFVVRRPFRDATGMISAGSIVEPADIKRFKHRLLEGHIVEVNEHNFETYAKFFKDKFGLTLQSPTAQVEVPDPVIPDPVIPVKNDLYAKPVTVKKVVKASTK